MVKRSHLQVDLLRHRGRQQWGLPVLFAVELEVVRASRETMPIEVGHALEVNQNSPLPKGYLGILLAHEASGYNRI